MKTTDHDYKQLWDEVVGRLSPAGVSLLFFIITIYSTVITIISRLTIEDSSVRNNYNLYDMVNLMGNVLIFQIILTAIFIIKPIAYRLQKLQIVILVVYMFKFGLESYVLVLMFYDYTLMSNVYGYAVISSIALGFIVLIFTLIYCSYRISKGHLREGGEGFHKLHRNSPLLLFPLFSGALIVVVGIILCKVQSGYVDYTFFLFLGFLMMIQYICFASIAEIIIVAYCKIEYPSFTVQPIKSRLNIKNFKIR
ncbi:hypothetical protein ABGV42_01865 [Paenibacillus pabuli]|uniref:hypothetical protein n=1 Tax=Paenibacillus pabuli TaxID=1472 RepID=UPI003242DBC7